MDPAPLVPRTELARRIRAVRALLGWTAPDLAAAIADATPAGQRVPLSLKQLREVEQEKRDLESDELRAIVDVGQVPGWFFTVDREDLFSDQGAAVEDMVAQAVAGAITPAVRSIGRIADQMSDLRDDLVRSEVIKPRGAAAIRVAEAAAARRSTPPTRETGSHRRRPGSEAG